MKTLKITTITVVSVSISDGTTTTTLNPVLCVASYDAGSGSLVIDCASIDISLSYVLSQYVVEINDNVYTGTAEDLPMALNTGVFVSPNVDVVSAVDTGTVATNSVKSAVDLNTTATTSVKTAVETGTTATNNVKTSVDLTTTAVNSGTTATNNVKTSVDAVKTAITDGTQLVQIKPTASPTACTITTTAAVGSGTVSANALYVEFITSSDFAGTISSLSIPNLAVKTYPYIPGYKYPAISYTVTAGTLYITSITG